MRRPVHLTYANVAATVAVIVALAGTTSAVAAVIISNNGQVAQNTISGHAPPSGKHANLISGSVSGKDLSDGFKASVADSCPAGLAKTEGKNDLCFETTLRPAANLDVALARCALAGLRLPTAGELAAVFNNQGAPQIYQWTDDAQYQDPGGFFYGTLLSDNMNREISFGAAPTNTPAAYRCVVTASH